MSSGRNIIVWLVAILLLSSLMNHFSETAKKVVKYKVARKFTEYLDLHNNNLLYPASAYSMHPRAPHNKAGNIFHHSRNGE